MDAIDEMQERLKEQRFQRHLAHERVYGWAVPVEQRVSGDKCFCEITPPLTIEEEK